MHQHPCRWKCPSHRYSSCSSFQNQFELWPVQELIASLVIKLIESIVHTKKYSLMARYKTVSEFVVVCVYQCVINSKRSDILTAI